MPSDILLTVGISVESLKTARTQIGAELKSWKFPETEQVSFIDKKQISDTKKFAVELKKEFEKIGSSIGKGDIVNISKAFAPVEEVGKAANFSSINLRKLAETSKFYNLQASVQGETLSNVRSQLSAYNRALADGSVTMSQVGNRYTELGVKFNQLSQEQNKMTQGLMAGVNLPRLLLWAVAWTVLYSAIREVLNAFSEIATTVSKVSAVLNQVRIVNNQTAAAFNKDYEEVRATIFNLSKTSLISTKQLADSFKILTFEGANLKTSLAALPNVRNLMVITGEKEGAVAQALIETYGLFKNKLEGASSESERLTRITDLLAVMFTKAHISLSEYQQLMSFIAPSAAEAVESFEFLTSLLVYADEKMLSGRRAGMALVDVLIQLTTNSQKLGEVFGITFKPGEIITVEKILTKIRASVVDLSEPEKRDLLSKIFKGASLELVLKLINETDESIRRVVRDADGLGESLKKGIEKAQPVARYFASIWKDIADKFSQVSKATNEVFEESRQVARSQGVKDKNLGILWELAEEKADDFRKSVEAARREGPFPVITLETLKIIAKSTDYIITLTQEEKKQLELLKQTEQYRLLEAAGASKTLLYEVAISDAINKSTMLIADEKARREAISALEQARVSTYEEIYKIARAQGIEEKQAQELVKEISEARLEIQLQMYEEIKSLADEIESKTVDFVKNLMSGTANVKDFMTSIIDVYKNAFATNIVKMFGESTGIFASMATVFMSPLQKAHYTGVQSAVPLIVKAHVDGITQGMASMQAGGAVPQAAGGISGLLQATGGGGTGGGMGSMTGFMGNVKDMMKFEKAPPKAGSAEALKGLPAAGKQQGSLAAAGKVAGQGLGAALAIYGAYEGIKAQKGQGAGMGALGGAMQGAMAGSLFGPIGMAVGAVVGAVAGAIMGSKKLDVPDPEIRTQTLELRSAINLSTKELQLVNRNLTGMRREFEGYFMQRSAYFSERMGVEERFNLDRQRGL